MYIICKAYFSTYLYKEMCNTFWTEEGIMYIKDSVRRQRAAHLNQLNLTKLKKIKDTSSTLNPKRTEHP